MFKNAVYPFAYYEPYLDNAKRSYYFRKRKQANILQQKLSMALQRMDKIRQFSVPKLLTHEV